MRYTLLTVLICRNHSYLRHQSFFPSSHFIPHLNFDSIHSIFWFSFSFAILIYAHFGNQYWVFFRSHTCSLHNLINHIYNCSYWLQQESANKFYKEPRNKCFRFASGIITVSPIQLGSCGITTDNTWANVYDVFQ